MSSELLIKSVRCFYEKPTTVDAALELAQRFRGDYQYIAGATDVEPLRKLELTSSSTTIDLSGIRELRELNVDRNTIAIGAMVTLDTLTSQKEITERWPLLHEATSAVATPVIRKTATVGGNLLANNRCTFYNQSKSWRTAIGSCLRDTGDTCLVTGLRNGKCFSRNISDLAPTLIALNAEVTIRNQRTQFTIPLSQLYVQDGIRFIGQLEDDGILTSIRVSKPAIAWGFRKLRLRRALDFTSLTIAACLDTQRIVRIGLNGIAMAPILITGNLVDLTLDEIQKQSRLKSKIVDNDLLPLKYRQEMLELYLEELWQILSQA